MRDMFDDFMEELRRRQAEQRRKNEGSDDQDAAEAAAGSGEEATNPPAESQGEGHTEDTPVTSGRGSGNGSDQYQDDDRNIFGGGPRRPRGPRGLGPEGEMPEIHIGRGWVIFGAIVVGLLVALVVFLSVGVSLWTDAIWYQSVGYADVFWTRVGSQVLLFVVGVVITLAVLWINVWVPGRLIPKGELRRFSLDDFLDRFNIDRYGGLGGGQFGPPRRPVVRSGDSIAVPDVARPVFWGLLGLSVLIALGYGGLLSSSWTTVQLYAHRVAFGQVDPSFGKDFSFYIFELPFFRLLQSFANSLLLLALILVAIRYAVAVISGASMSTAARVHVGLLVALYLFSIAVGFQLDRYGLVYSDQSGIFQGVSYTDANARILAINVMTVLAAFAGMLFLGFTFTRWWVPLALTIAIWMFAYVALDFAYPLAVQRFAVEPNQQGQETPYIQNNIQMTRLGFNLNGWTSVPYQPGATVTSDSLANEQPTIQNLRLWDYRPLKPTLENMQLLRQYYSFVDVDTDRYTFTDPASCAPNPAPCVRQVMLAGRELDPSKVADLNNGNSSWVNLHLIYTHGVGLAMLPVNEVVRSQTNQSANPNLVIQNVPPVSSPGAPKVTEPRIYFGTESSEYVIVDGSTEEFDYPASSSSGDAYYRWTGTTGIKLDSTFTKLLFSARLGDLNLLISNQVTGNSQLLWRRSIRERVAELAPFLRYDKDPYLAITSSGRLVYILDAFTTSDALPDANTFDPSTDPGTGLAGDPFNYIRNSVKVVMDAYDGTTSFYVADPSDPIIRAWSGVFPNLFKPISAMPEDIRGSDTVPSHLRYPEDLFDAQTLVYEKYHVTDAGVFYQGNDVWQVARNSGTSGSPMELGLEAYYVEMQTPGQTDLHASEFLLLQPMVPSGRPNMIAWVAAHNDPAEYGTVSVYDFPRDSTIYGPAQMSALILQNPVISQQITLWGQQGSTVIMGNLLVVPLQNSILYVQPVYMSSNTNPLPVLQKVVVATPSQIVWGDTLQSALTQLVTGGGNVTPTPSPGPTATPTPSVGPSPTGPTGSPTSMPTAPSNATAQQLIALANQHYEAAQEALRNGDLGTYQKEMNTVGEILQQLQSLLGTPAP
jgi:uncharacterized membrane protein (UPF0182 family)